MKFLDDIFGDKKIYFRCLKEDNPTISLHGYYDEIMKLELAGYNQEGYNIYFVVNSPDHEEKENKNFGYSDDDIAIINTLFVDLDADEYYKTKNLTPEQIKEYKKLKWEEIHKFDFKPSYIIQTKKGFHVYWLLEPGATIDEFISCEEWLIAKFQADEKAQNPARLMRLPEFYHVKDPKNPYPVCVVEDNNIRYKISDIIEKCGIKISPHKTEPNSFKLDNNIKSYSGQIILNSREEILDYLKRQDLKAFLGIDSDKKLFNCIFHNDNNPSANIIIDEKGYQYYYCFGCDWNKKKNTEPNKWKIGTIIDCVMKLQGLNFPDALKYLMDYYGIISNDPLDLFFNGNTFIPKKLGDWFLNKYYCFVMNDILYIYKDGVYIEGETTFKNEVTKKLGDCFKINRVNETLAYIKNIVQNLEPNDVVNTGKYLNVKNGIIDLEALEFKPHTPELKTIIQLPVQYNPDAKCPHIDKFLNMILPEDCIKIVEEMIGYCLIPSNVYEKSFLFHGEGGNGKGTLIEIITNLLGNNNVSHISLHELMSDKFAPAGLFGKMANLYADIPKTYIEDTALFKLSTSQDNIRAQEKYGKPFDFKPRAKMIFSANNLPPTGDNTYGYFRRWVIIPFRNSFNDRELREKLFLKKELSGLLNRALMGLKRLKAQNGFTESELVNEEMQDYKKTSDSSYLFLTEYCVESQNDMINKQALYDAYKAMCEDWGLKPINQGTFNKNVLKIYPNVSEYRNTKIGGKGRKWKGIKIIDKKLSLYNYQYQDKIATC